MRRHPVAHPAERLAEALDSAAGQAGITTDAVGALVIGLPGAFDEGPVGCGTPRTCPGGTTSPPGAARRALRVPVASRTTSTWPRWPSSAAGRRGAARTSSTAGPARGSARPSCWAAGCARGATGGAGEIGFMPVPGAPASCAGSPGRTPAASRSWRAGRRCCAGARARGRGPHRRGRSSPRPRPRRTASRQWTAGRAGDPLRDRPRLRGQRARPPLVVLAGSVMRAGGEPLRARVARELERAGPGPSVPGGQQPWRATPSSRRAVRRPGPRSATRSSRPADPALPVQQEPARPPNDPVQPTGGIRASTTRDPSCSPRPWRSPCSRPGAPARPPAGGRATPSEPVTITFWHGWSAPSEVEAIQAQHRRASRRRTPTST